MLARVSASSWSRRRSALLDAFLAHPYQFCESLAVALTRPLRPRGSYGSRFAFGLSYDRAATSFLGTAVTQRFGLCVVMRSPYHRLQEDGPSGPILGQVDPRADIAHLRSGIRVIENEAIHPWTASRKNYVS